MSIKRNIRVFGVLRYGDYFYMLRRYDGVNAGAFEFPNGEIDKEESVYHCLQRTLIDAVDMSITDLTRFNLFNTITTRDKDGHETCFRYYQIMLQDPIETPRLIDTTRYDFGMWTTFDAVVDLKVIDESAVVLPIMCLLHKK